MATLVLTAVGTAIAGPLGGLVGSFLGASIDRAVFGSGRQQGSRSGNLAVQSSAYGEPIPRIYGRMRVAGNLIWSPGIRESKARSGGGKQRSGTGYTYSASFAVALAARRVGSIGRIWADGKLLRNSDGSFVIATTMRFYPGTESQSADPLIVATEGVAHAPAYRGIAYVVFEDLALADYGNRIPNLTFEIIADSAVPDAADIAADLFGAVGLPAPATTGVFAQIHGFAALHAGSLRSQLETLMPLADLAIGDFGAGSAGGLVLRGGPGDVAASIPAADLGTVVAGEAIGTRQFDTRAAAAAVPDAVAIGFFDPARDYQLGLQRAVRRAPVQRCEQHDIAVAFAAPAAKALGERIIGAALARRTTGEVRLPWRHAAVRVGDTIMAGADPLPWRVRNIALETMVVRLTVERLPNAARQAVRGASTADAGRSLANLDLPNGPTEIHLLDLPPLPGALPGTPRIWIAAAGPQPGWRSAEIDVSVDDGDSYSWVGTISDASVMGVADQALAAGPAHVWDWHSSLEVTLLNAAMWLESRPVAAVLAGANLALVGDELIQFAEAVPIAPGRFRLSGLLRGRRGSEAEIGRHAAGERFVVLDAARLFAFDPPFDAMGRSFQFRASHRSGAVNSLATVVPVGRALQPLAPAHLALLPRPDGGVAARWVRRSRAGFGWTDGTDAPLAEDSERYRVELWHDGSLVRAADTSTPVWDYDGAARLADGIPDPALFEVRVRQTSGLVGAGNSAIAQITVG